MDMDTRELIIIGGGPAGYTAALYAARADLNPLVIEGFNWGGQLMITSDVENYPGFVEGIMGPELMASFRSQAERFGADYLTDDVTRVDFSEQPLRVWVEDEEFRARAVIVASSNIFTFSAGADIKEFTKMDPSKEGPELIEAGHGLMTGMEKSSTVTIAAVNSLAFGGGCELAMSCDFRIAAESATFGQPEINLGIMPGFGGTQRLPRLVGEGKALEMNLTGDPISAYEAERLGLANEVVPDHELFDTALAWARAMAEKAPIAIEQIKSVSAMGELGEGLEAEAHGFGKAFGSEDAKEGISAFLGKRKPRFQGK